MDRRYLLDSYRRDETTRRCLVPSTSLLRLPIHTRARHPLGRSWAKLGKGGEGRHRRLARISRPMTYPQFSAGSRVSLKKAGHDIYNTDQLSMCISAKLGNFFDEKQFPRNNQFSIGNV